MSQNNLQIPDYLYSLYSVMNQENLNIIWEETFKSAFSEEMHKIKRSRINKHLSSEERFWEFQNEPDEAEFSTPIDWEEQEAQRALEEGCDQEEAKEAAESRAHAALYIVIEEAVRILVKEYLPAFVMDASKKAKEVYENDS
jgi:hypothetical protein